MQYLIIVFMLISITVHAQQTNLVVSATVDSFERQYIEPPLGSNYVWEAKIGVLVANGSLVDKGEIIAEFVPDKLHRDIQKKEVEKQGLVSRLNSLNIEQKAKLEGLMVEELRSKYNLENKTDILNAENKVTATKLKTLEHKSTMLVTQSKADLSKTKLDISKKIHGIERHELEVKITFLDNEINDLKTVLNSFIIRAKFKGYISYFKNWQQKTPKIGDIVSVGENIAVLLDESTMHVSFSLPESLYQDVKEGLVDYLLVDRTNSGLSTKLKINEIGTRFYSKSQNDQIVFDVYTVPYDKSYALTPELVLNVGVSIK